MSDLDRKMVEHHLPIKIEFKSYEQPLRRMSPKVILKVKFEIGRLLKAGFIRVALYVEWLSNIVLVVKKNNKI